MGLLNHMCQISNTCVTFGTREYTGLLFSTLRSLTSQVVNPKMRLWTLALAFPYPCLQGTTSCSLTIFHLCSQMKYYLVRSLLGKINRLMRIWVTDSCLRSFFGSTHHMARHVVTKVLPEIADLTPRIWNFFKRKRQERQEVLFVLDIFVLLLTERLTIEVNEKLFNNTEWIHRKVDVKDICSYSSGLYDISRTLIFELKIFNRWRFDVFLPKLLMFSSLLST